MKTIEIDRIKRAIQSCKNKIKHHYEHTHNKVSNAIRNEYTKITALEKQIPKKAIWLETDFSDMIQSCPNCSKPVTNYFSRGVNPMYCQFCGQALDWEDNE